MKILNRKTAKISKINPNRILQFGGGNFLRAFIGWIIEEYNEVNIDKIGVTVVKVTPRGSYEEWKSQDGLYHVISKGIKAGSLVNESKLITNVQNIMSAYADWNEFIETARQTEMRYLFSNTTESGIVYKSEDLDITEIPESFPGKLTLWLLERYKYFGGTKDSGVVIIPCELLENNGELLKECIFQYIQLWNLEIGFKAWIEESCHFCKTLVDRIVPGVSNENRIETYEKLGYQDVMVTEGEPYHFLAIEAPKEIQKELPLDKIGLNIIYTEDLNPYRLRKVRILNGAHSSMVPVGYLFGLRTVKEVMDDPIMSNYIEKLVGQEIIPATNLDKEELKNYASEIMDRFRNPFIKHQLISIALNSFSKYKSRILPSVLDYIEKQGKLPTKMIFAFACMLKLYSGRFNGEDIALKDDDKIIQLMSKFWKDCDGSLKPIELLVERISGDESLWGQNLNEIPQFSNTVASFLLKMEDKSIKEIVSSLN